MTPNQATYMMLLFSIVSFIMLFIVGNFILFGIFVFITGIFDGIDGAIARLNNKSSKYGGFLDSSLDRISEVIIYAAIFLSSERILGTEYTYSILFRTMVWITCFCSILISYLRSRASNEFKGDLDIGLFARSERLFSIFIISIIPFPYMFLIGFMILTIGIVATAGFRFFRYKRFILSEKNKNSLSN